MWLDKCMRNPSAYVFMGADRLPIQVDNLTYWIIETRLLSRLYIALIFGWHKSRSNAIKAIWCDNSSRLSAVDILSNHCWVNCHTKDNFKSRHKKWIAAAINVAILVLLDLLKTASTIIAQADAVGLRLWYLIPSSGACVADTVPVLSAVRSGLLACAARRSLHAGSAPTLVPAHVLAGCGRDSKTRAAALRGLFTSRPGCGPTDFWMRNLWHEAASSEQRCVQTAGPWGSSACCR